MTWADGAMAAFDLETTGTDVTEARIVTASVMRVGGGDTDYRGWLLNPGVEIPEQASKVHGITTEYASTNGLDPVEPIAEMTALLADHLANGTPLVVFNAPFDLTLLEAECRRYSLPTLSDRLSDDDTPLRVIDPLVLDKHADKWRRGKRTLSVVAEHYGITLTEDDAHTSAGDCLAAARVAWRMSRVYPEIGAMSLEDLMGLQAAAHERQAASLEAHFRKTDPAAVVERGWPIRQAVTA